MRLDRTQARRRGLLLDVLRFVGMQPLAPFFWLSPTAALAFSISACFNAPPHVELTVVDPLELASGASHVAVGKSLLRMQARAMDGILYLTDDCTGFALALTRQ